MFTKINGKHVGRLQCDVYPSYKLLCRLTGCQLNGNVYFTYLRFHLSQFTFHNSYFTYCKSKEILGTPLGPKGFYEIY